MDTNPIDELNTMVLKLWENSEVGMFNCEKQPHIREKRKSKSKCLEHGAFIPQIPQIGKMNYTKV